MTDVLRSTVRYLILHVHVPQGLRRPAGEDGRIGEQGRYTQADRHTYRCGAGAVLCLEAVLLIPTIKLCRLTGKKISGAACGSRGSSLYDDRHGALVFGY